MTLLKQSVFEQLKSLKELCLNKNLIIEIEADAFRGLDSLQRLYFNGNEIIKLDRNTFEGLNNLKVLELNQHLKKPNGCLIVQGKKW